MLLKVTVIEFLDRILPGGDKEIGKSFERILKKQGFKFKLSTGVQSSEVTANGVTLNVASAKGGKEESLEFDVVLVATGNAQRSARRHRIDPLITRRAPLARSCACQDASPTPRASGSRRWASKLTNLAGCLWIRTSVPRYVADVLARRIPAIDVLSTTDSVHFRDWRCD